MAVLKFETLPARVNTARLIEELKEAGAEVAFVRPQISVTKPDDTVEVEPPRVEVIVADDADAATFEAVIAAHSPLKTDVEEQAAHDESETSRAAEKLLQLLLKTPALKKALKDALAS